MTDYPGSGAPGAERPAYPPPPGYPEQPQEYPEQPQEYPEQPQDYPQQPQDYPQQPPGYPPPGQELPQAPPVPAEYGYGQHPQGAIPAGMYYDEPSGLLLPNGTELASVGRRIGAWFLAIPLWIVTLGIGYIVWGLILWGRGQTPALQLLGMRVWRPDDQRPASFGYMALREIVGRIVDGILSIITELTSFIMMCASKDRKTLHDMVAGTVVLHDPNKVLEPSQNQN
jgi:uncharacterized RDD family membrane protein YckC